MTIKILALYRFTCNCLAFRYSASGCDITTVLTLAKNYHKVVHVWDSLTALVDLWHPQTHTFIFPAFEATILLEGLELIFGLPKDKKGEEYDISYTVAPIDSWAIHREITTKSEDLRIMTS
ncbi:hypothetical protein Taro_055462 [Colocasia esculenta]|uniref:Aminotransferase-like plant mobile domain-containing protein n=1 Tax=Colocasia esculenta TaxID=4460 RepID=A0A843XTQ5_COLES|nr:hypothetical protein [Colocasia esculenta]